MVPSNGTAGTVVTVLGNSFNATVGTVIVGGTASAVLFWNDTMIQFIMPIGVGVGLNVLVINSYIQSSAPNTLWSYNGMR